ncbi:MAG: phosphoribosyl-ATP diphosphatase [Pirellulaceae bacterium]
MADQTVFDELMAVIQQRKANPPARSYTTTLLQGGVDRMGCKVMEEAAEVVRAARKSDEAPEKRQQLVAEAADLVYHLFVLLGYRDIALGEVEAELARRFGISGLDEKAARPANPPSP